MQSVSWCESPCGGTHGKCQQGWEAEGTVTSVSSCVVGLMVSSEPLTPGNPALSSSMSTCLPINPGLSGLSTSVTESVYSCTLAFLGLSFLICSMSGSAR